MVSEEHRFEARRIESPKATQTSGEVSDYRNVLLKTAVAAAAAVAPSGREHGYKDRQV